MKTFKITYIKHGNVCNYNKEDTIQAVSAKMALKKWFNYRDPCDSTRRTRRQWMDYDGWANGISYSNFEVTEVQA